MTGVIVVFVLAAMLFPIGLWGYRGAASLAVVPGMSEERISRRRRVMRRGAVTCMVVSAVFVVAAGLSFARF